MLNTSVDVRRVFVTLSQLRSQCVIASIFPFCSDKICTLISILQARRSNFRSVCLVKCTFPQTVLIFLIYLSAIMMTFICNRCASTACKSIFHLDSPWMCGTGRWESLQSALGLALFSHIVGDLDEFCKTEKKKGEKKKKTGSELRSNHIMEKRKNTNKSHLGFGNLSAELMLSNFMFTRVRETAIHFLCARNLEPQFQGQEGSYT